MIRTLGHLNPSRAALPAQPAGRGWFGFYYFYFALDATGGSATAAMD
ncbi:MAG TPA: hypothetical protein VHL09_15405 [Dehalococcoidia bacterium]|nr:hypothetical protein [Dehalococcoidia bacterium]